MRSRRLRRPVLAIVMCAAAMMAVACFGGGGSQPTTQPATATTPTGPSATGISPVASPPALPSPFPLASPAASPSPRPATGPEQSYTVEAGDTLGKIAERFYNDSTQWRKIYEANRAAIGDNPDALKVGTQLRIPPRD